MNNQTVRCTCYIVLKSIRHLMSGSPSISLDLDLAIILLVECLRVSLTTVAGTSLAVNPALLIETLNSTDTNINLTCTCGAETIINTHHSQHRLPGYLILFDSHALVPQRQLNLVQCLRPLVVPQLLSNSTYTPGVLWTSWSTLVTIVSKVYSGQQERSLH
jgi:hypothetical protein